VTDPVRAIDLLLGTAWAIDPESMQTIVDIAQRANDAPEAVAARLGRPLDNTRRVTERDGAAVIPISGPIFRRANLFTEISGATSVEVLAQDLATAIADPSINNIVLEIDSPGGQATGIAELAAQIRDSSKPIIAYVDGMAASAAYWLAAAADTVIVSPTALIGSIGVVASYRTEKDAPIRIISSVSPLKQASPDTDAGRAEAQRIVDELAAVFVADIAAYRNTSVEQVLQDFGRGGVRVGADAVSVGMADSVGTFESIFSTAGAAGQMQPRGIRMTYQDQVNTALGLPADASADQATQAIEHHRNSAIDAARSEGADAEHQRVTAILAAVADAPHARGLADAAIANGLRADQAQAMIDAAPLPAQRDSTDGRSEFRAAMLDEGRQQAAPAPTAAGADDTAPEPGSDEALKAAWDANADLRKDFGGQFDRYKAFKAAESAGRVKILGRK
jgi:ClpP class serine protease